MRSLKITVGLLLLIQAFHLVSPQSSAAAPRSTIDQAWLRQLRRQAAANQNATGDGEYRELENGGEYSGGAPSGLMEDDRMDFDRRESKMSNNHSTTGVNSPEIQNGTKEQPETNNTDDSGLSTPTTKTISSRVNQTEVEKEKDSTSVQQDTAGVQDSSNSSNAETTTVAPVNKAAPVDTTAPVDGASPVTTAAPPVTTAAPPVDGASPVTTAAPPVTTAAPPVTTAAPPVDGASPVTTAVPPATTAAPPVDGTSPVTTAAPPATTVAPPVDGTSPVTTAAPPVTTTAPPVDTGSKDPLAVTANPGPEMNVSLTESPSAPAAPETTAQVAVTAAAGDLSDKNAASGDDSDRGSEVSDPRSNARQQAWGAVLATAVAVACVGLVAYIIMKKKYPQGFSHRKLVEEYPSDPVLRLDNSEPLDLNFGRSSGYHNPGLQDDIQLSNIPTRR